MNEAQFMDALRTLARHIVRNELVCEHFLESQGISRESIWIKAREIDHHLQEHTDWQNRFPGLFDQGTA
jgi:Mn-dependent DtxR family transcriptional regulator